MKKEKQDFKLSVSNIYFSKILLTGLILFLVIEFKIKLNFFFLKQEKSGKELKVIVQPFF